MRVAVCLCVYVCETIVNFSKVKFGNGFFARLFVRLLLHILKRKTTIFLMCLRNLFETFFFFISLLSNNISLLNFLALTFNKKTTENRNGANEGTKDRD